MTRLDELLLEWEARLDRGDSVTADVLCPDDTILRSTLAERIELVEEFNRFFLRSEDDPLGPEPDADPLPAAVGKYEIRGRLGTGGMGVVYLGFDPTLKRKAAVKMIRREKLSVAPKEAAARFAREGEVLARLGHTNIVTIYEGGSHEDGPFLAMEYVPGGTLSAARERIRDQGPQAVAALVEKVARAVQVAHEHKPPIYHRDLKPSNILLTEGDEPKIADSGLAKLLDPESLADDDVTADVDTGEMRSLATIGGGTPGYMAPEQAEPFADGVTAATDVWALGVVLHELLTGDRPSPWAAPDPERVTQEVPGDLGRRLAEVVGRCLRESPAERYQTAAELADALAEPIRPKRRVARWAVAAVALVGVAAAAAAYSVDWAEWRNQSQDTEIRTRLARGETVPLVEAGKQRPLYRVRGDRLLTHVQWWNNGLRVESTGDCSLVDLLSVPTGTHLQVEAVVQVNRVLNVKSAWGVFLDHATSPGGEVDGHHFDYAGFCESFDRVNPSDSVLAQYHIRSPVGDDPGIDLWHQVSKLPLNPPAERHPLRDVVVSLRDTVTARCGFSGLGRPPAELGPIGIDERELFRHELRTKFGVPFAGRSGPSVRIGLFARHCDVTVHRLTVRLLPPSQE